MGQKLKTWSFFLQFFASQLQYAPHASKFTRLLNDKRSKTFDFSHHSIPSYCLPAMCVISSLLYSRTHFKLATLPLKSAKLKKKNNKVKSSKNTSWRHRLCELSNAHSHMVSLSFPSLPYSLKFEHSYLFIAIQILLSKQQRKYV